MRMRINASMNLKAEIANIEKRLKAKRLPVAALLRQAEVDVAQWQRWKKGTQGPRLATWQRIERAADLLAPAEAA
jgi:hypothetical protein